MTTGTGHITIVPSFVGFPCPAITGPDHYPDRDGVCRNCGHYDPTHDRVNGQTGERAL